MIKVIGLGAGGHARVVLEVIRLAGGCEVVAFLSAGTDRDATSVADVPVAGGDELLPMFKASGVTHAVVAVGSVGSAALRRRLFDVIVQAGLIPLTAVHPAAVVSSSATLGDGTVIMAGAIVNSGAVVGRNVIVNTGAIVEHDCRLGDHVHIATGAQLAGGVMIGDAAHVGLGASVLQNLEIGARAVVGAGAVVTANVAADTTVVGVPARVLPPGGRS